MAWPNPDDGGTAHAFDRVNVAGLADDVQPVHRGNCLSQDNGSVVANIPGSVVLRCVTEGVRALSIVGRQPHPIRLPTAADTRAVRSRAVVQVERLNDLPGLKEWLNGGPVPPVRVCEAGEELLASPGEDALAGIYSAAVSPANRRRLGTFFTPRAEVQQMLAAWTLLGAEPPQTVVDVGAGVGIFTLAAAHLWPAAGLHAVDVNPVTLGLLGLRAATDHVLTETTNSHGGGVHLHLEDYLDFAQTELPSLPGPRLILGNPYTRIQLLPPDERQRLIESTGGLCGSRASLAAVITAATIQSMGAEDGLCLLLPAHWLESDYASGLRSWLWAATSRPVRLHLFGHDLFPDAQVDTVSLLVGPVADGDHPIAAEQCGLGHEGGARAGGRVPNPLAVAVPRRGEATIQPAARSTAVRLRRYPPRHRDGGELLLRSRRTGR